MRAAGVSSAERGGVLRSSEGGPTTLGTLHKFEATTTPRRGRRSWLGQNNNREAKKERRVRRRARYQQSQTTMARTFALVAYLVALVAQASAFMIATGSAGAAATIRQGAAMSGFTGCSPVCQRDATSDRSTLRMMVSCAHRQMRERTKRESIKAYLVFFLAGPTARFALCVCTHALRGAELKGGELSSPKPMVTTFRKGVYVGVLGLQRWLLCAFSMLVSF